MIVMDWPEFRFTGLNGASGTCSLKLYLNERGRKIAVASALIMKDGSYACDGVSITNAIEKIAQKVFNQLGFTFDDFVEYYPERGPNLHRRLKDPMFMECFALVSFEWSVPEPDSYAREVTFAAPHWEFVTRSEVETLIGQPHIVDYLSEPVDSN